MTAFRPEIHTARPVDWLLASILILGLGPLLYRLAQSRKRWLSGLDGFLLVAIAGLVLLDVLPETFEQSGWVGLIFVVAGFWGPTLIEHSFHGLARSTHRIAIVLGLMSLALHALFDGAALVEVPGTYPHGFRALPLAIVLHRLPEGLTVWWLLRPAFGTRVAAAVLVLISGATASGFLLGESVMAGTSSQALSLFRALVAGSLLHVIVHRTELRDPRPSDPRWRNLLGALGGLAGVGLLVWVVGGTAVSSAGSSRVLTTLWRLTLESAPALVLAYFLAGFLSVFLPAASVRWMSRGRTPTQALKGMTVGLPLPVCSCGVVPLFRSLSRRGTPAAAAAAFLIATPELSLDAILLSFPLLGSEIAVARLVAAAAVAMLVGVAVGLVAPGRANSGSGSDEVTDPLPGTPALAERFRKGLKTGLVELVDDTAPWILVGLGVAAWLEPTLSPDLLSRFPGFLEVPVFAALGIPLYVCASGATPLVAVLLLKGISPGAAIAFLLTGPATNLSTFGVVSDTLGRRTALVFGLSAATLSVAFGYLINTLQLSTVQLALESEAASPWGGLGIASAIVLGALFVLSFLRQGPRNFLGQLGISG